MKPLGDTIKTHFIKEQSYWEIVNPIMFLDTLKKYPNDLFVISVQPEGNWYNKKYLKKLKKYKKDNTPCGKSVSIYSNILFIGGSNLCKESEKIILGINLKKYP